MELWSLDTFECSNALVAFFFNDYYGMFTDGGTSYPVRGCANTYGNADYLVLNSDAYGYVVGNGSPFTFEKATAETITATPFSIGVAKSVDNNTIYSLTITTPGTYKFTWEDGASSTYLFKIDGTYEYVYAGSNLTLKVGTYYISPGYDGKITFSFVE